MGLDQAGELANATPRAKVGLMCWEKREPVCMDKCVVGGGGGESGRNEEKSRQKQNHKKPLGAKEDV